MFHKTQHETISQKYLNNILQSVKQQIQLCQGEVVTEKESWALSQKGAQAAKDNALDSSVTFKNAKGP